MNTLYPAVHTQIKRRVKSDARPLSYSVLTVICGTVMIAGFFFAARQHFSSIDYGIKNSRLRKQVDQLESEKRRLLLVKEVSVTPVELLKAQQRISYSSSISKAGSNTRRAQAIKAVSPASAVSGVQKTGSSKPAAIASAVAAKPYKVEKKATSIKENKDRS